MGTVNLQRLQRQTHLQLADTWDMLYHNDGTVTANKLCIESSRYLPSTDLECHQLTSHKHALLNENAYLQLKPILEL